MTKAFELVARGLPQYGWDVRLVDIADPGTGRPNGAFSLLRARSVATAALAIARQLPSVDVVYLTISQSRLGFAKDALFLRLVALFGRPVVVHMHGGNFGNFFQALRSSEQRLVRNTLDRVARIIVLTESLRADFSMTRDWAARTVAISNACDMSPGQQRTPPTDSLRILFMSNLVVAKGYQDLITAVALLARRLPHRHIYLDMAGALAHEKDFPDAGAQAADLEARLAVLPPTVTARYHGIVSGEQKARLFTEADVFVLPTWYVNEGQPIALLEALSAGLPVIATDWRGIRESLPVSMHPLLVSPKNPQAIADQLEGIAADPAVFAAQSRDALAQGANFHPHRHLSAIDDVLRKACGTGN